MVVKYLSITVVTQYKYIYVNIIYDISILGDPETHEVIIIIYFYKILTIIIMFHEFEPGIRLQIIPTPTFLLFGLFSLLHENYTLYDIHTPQYRKTGS